MSTPRRRFLHAMTGIAAASAATAAHNAAGTPAAGVLPKVHLGKAELSRLIIGENPFYGYSHFNRILDQTMREWYTPERVVDVLRRSEQGGINTWEFTHSERSIADLKRFQAEGGGLQWILLSSREMVENPAVIRDMAKLKPLAIVHHGGVTDRLFRDGKSQQVHDFLKRVRDAGVLAGMSTHNPDNVRRAEEQNWDLDLYMTCCYRLTRTPEEIRQITRELPLPAGEVYLEGDPERMFQVVRQTKKTCLAFKVLAAGRRIGSAEQVDAAFRFAFDSIKPQDCIIVGMYPRYTDEVRENCDRVRRVLRAT
ncbi:MAG TPA: hypothetical protein VN428_05765 [Bryobacteraceae bacterium]|nr:hypothetical protein [Bryobacteraceae bacterium]